MTRQAGRTPVPVPVQSSWQRRGSAFTHAKMSQTKHNTRDQRPDQGLQLRLLPSPAPAPCESTARSQRSASRPQAFEPWQHALSYTERNARGGTTARRAEVQQGPRPCASRDTQDSRGPLIVKIRDFLRFLTPSPPTVPRDVSGQAAHHRTSSDEQNAFQSSEIVFGKN